MRLAFVLLATVAGFASGFTLFRGSKSPPAEGKALPATSAAESSMSLTGQTSPDTRKERLEAALRADSKRGQRESEIHLALEEFSAADFQRLLGNEKELRALLDLIPKSEGELRSNLVNAMIVRWLRLDRSAVVAWAPQALDFGDAAGRSAIWNTLPREIPEEMLALLPSRKDRIERLYYSGQAMRTLAARDNIKARQLLEKIQDKETRSVAESGYRLGMLQADPLQAIAMAETMTERESATRESTSYFLRTVAENAAKTGSGVLRQLATMPMKSWMADAIMGEVAKHDPELAVELAAKTLPGDGPVDSAVCNAFAALTERDPALCLAKLPELEGTKHASAVSAIGMSWVAQDPAAALNWLLQWPESERSSYHIRRVGVTNDVLVQGFSDWAKSSPNEARVWAEALPDGSLRTTLQAEVATALASNGRPAEAVQVLNSLGSAVPQKAIFSAASKWAATDPQAAADWAVALEPGPLQNGALTGIVKKWADTDLQGTENWLSSFPPGLARDHSVNAFLQRDNTFLTSSQEQIAEFDHWFGMIDDPWLRTKAAIESYYVRARSTHDPVAARKWLDSIPNTDPDLIRWTLRNAK